MKTELRAPCLVLVMGLPGTGKSYFASALASRLNVPYLNSDIVRAKLNLRGNYDEMVKQKVYQGLLDLVRHELKLGKSVIVDATFIKKDKRSEFEKIAQILNLPVYRFLLIASEEVIEERTSKKRLHSEADFDVYLKLKKEFEPIDKDHQILDSGSSTLEEMLVTAISYLNLNPDG